MIKNKYRSKFEVSVAQSLSDKGIDFSYEEYKLEYFLKVIQGSCESCGSKNVYQSKWYLPDFYLPSKDMFIEAKGRFTSKDRTKMKAVMEAHPDKDIRILFMRDQKVHKLSDMYYSDWCKNHGIKYAFKEVPNEWL